MIDDAQVFIHYREILNTSFTVKLCSIALIQLTAAVADARWVYAFKGRSCKFRTGAELNVEPIGP